MAELSEEHLKEMVNKLIQRIEVEVPESGDFNRISEYIDNPDPDRWSNVGKYSLRILCYPSEVQPDPRIRYLEIAAFIPSGAYKAEFAIGHGTKEDILKQMKSPEFMPTIIDGYIELSRCLEDFD